MKYTALATCLLALLNWNCSTELDVNAPYKEITIVYAALSKTQPDGVNPEITHYVKINRAFQGSDNAFTYAAIPDSNEYNDEQLESARVQEWAGNTLIAEFDLRDTIIPDRLPGTFYYPEQKVYYFNAALNQDHEYRFVAIVKGLEVTATTPIVNDFSLASNVQSPAFRPTFFNNNGYLDYELKWDSGDDGRRYEAYFTFYYREFTSPTDSVSKSFTRLIGSAVTVDTDGGDEQVVSLAGQDFYTTVASQVPVDPSVIYRKFLGIQFHWAVASADFHTFLLLSEPITGIVEDRPDFTNVTNGYGIFVSRFFKRAPGSGTNLIPASWNPTGAYRTLSETSLEYLANGPVTGDRGFCVPYAFGTTYSCP
ncbi:MAG: hypothetical protein ABI599_13605 [Flavobacteriales bacterium]